MSAQRLALIADVHANLAALDATLAAISSAGIARGAVAGDLVTRGRRPEEVVRRVRALGWPVAQGNTDRKLAATRRSPDHPRAGQPGSRRWSRLRVTNGTVDYLAELPILARVMVGPWRILIAHEGPDGPGHPLGTHLDGDEVDALAARHEVDAIVVGHTHQPQIVRGATGLLINPGSVGEGTPSERRPSWGWLDSEDGRLIAGLERVPAEVADLRGQ